MIKYDSEEFQKIQLFFPDLFYEPKNGCIKGEFGINARYEKRSKKIRKDYWEIVSCTSNDDCPTDCYEIKIYLNKIENRWPKVFETGGKIQRLAEELGKPISDLHLDQDNSCCLGIPDNPDITLYNFVLRKVYTYFVWQAYFAKYKKIPPCGEYSHGDQGAREFEKDRKAQCRNNLCICGSGKKYKKCCWGRRKIVSC